MTLLVVTLVAGAALFGVVAATSSLEFLTERAALQDYDAQRFGAQASGNADKFKGFAEECMAEYDLDGWKVPDLTDPGELSYHVLRANR